MRDGRSIFQIILQIQFNLRILTFPYMSEAKPSWIHNFIVKHTIFKLATLTLKIYCGLPSSLSLSKKSELLIFDVHLTTLSTIIYTRSFLIFANFCKTTSTALYAFNNHVRISLLKFLITLFMNQLIGVF
jgi:hypothetical protein